MVAKIDIIVQDLLLTCCLLIMFVFYGKLDLLSFINSLYKQVQLITSNENNVL